MKKQKWMASMLAAASMLTVIPKDVFAQSQNHIDKVVTVGIGHTLSTEEVPHLVIELNDGLSEGDTFYLKLEHAVWNVGTENDEIKALADDEEGHLETKKITDTMLEVKVKAGGLKRGQYISIPILAEINDKEAQVEIDSNNTNISPAAYTFAKGSSQKAAVVVMKPAVTAKDAALESITIEEPYQGFFAESDKENKSRVITVTMDQSDYKWDVSKAQIKGIKGFEGLAAEKEAFEVIDGKTLKITLPKVSEKLGKGDFVITGLQLMTSSKEASARVIQATFQGEQIETTTCEVAKVQDYGVSLTVDKIADVYAGESSLVEFDLEETVADSLFKERGLEITFNEGTSLDLNADQKVEVTFNNEVKAYSPIYEEGIAVGFEVPSIDNEFLKQNFSVRVNTSLSKTGENVEVMAEGRALGDKELTQKALHVIKPVAVTMETARLRVGVKDQKAGEITIKENGAGAIQSGKSIFIQMEKGDYSLSKLPEVEVISGDLQLGQQKEVEGGLEIPVTAGSTKPSTIVIRPYVTVSGLSAQGYYKAAVGGPALSERSVSKMTDQNEIQDIDPVIFKDFLKIGKISAEAKTTAVFTINKNIYSVNGEPSTMDVMPYNKNGRTMLPVKYVAYALGLDESQVEWDNEKKIVTIYGDQTVQLTLWSKEMFIDGVPTIMSAPATLDRGRTFIPVAEVARALNVEVSWNNETKSATFKSY